MITNWTVSNENIILYGRVRVFKGLYINACVRSVWRLRAPVTRALGACRELTWTGADSRSDWPPRLHVYRRIPVRYVTCRAWEESYKRRRMRREGCGIWVGQLGVHSSQCTASSPNYYVFIYLCMISVLFWRKFLLFFFVCFISGFYFCTEINVQK